MFHTWQPLSICLFETFIIILDKKNINFKQVLTTPQGAPTDLRILPYYSSNLRMAQNFLSYHITESVTFFFFNLASTTFPTVGEWKFLSWVHNGMKDYGQYKIGILLLPLYFLNYVYKSFTSYIEM